MLRKVRAPPLKQPISHFLTALWLSWLIPICAFELCPDQFSQSGQRRGGGAQQSGKESSLCLGARGPASALTPPPTNCVALGSPELSEPRFPRL